MNNQTKTSRREFLESSTRLLALGACAGAGFAAEAAAKGKRIGFVDDNLNNYHANVFLEALRGPLKDRGFSLAGATGLKKAESQAWAEKNNVPWRENVAKLDPLVDYYMVLAPSTPDTHLGLCQTVFPFGKPVYVDKTFAPDAATALKIFELADTHRAPVQTSSALRYTNVQESLRQPGALPVEHMITWGGGGSYDEYAIHPIELLVSVLGHEAQALMRRRGGPSRSQLLINFSNERTGVVNVYTQSNTQFAASLTTAKETKHLQVDTARIFVNNLAAILDFFAAGKPNIDRRESLAIMRLLDAARSPQALKDFVPIAAS